jgi:hypothetical protein
MSKSMKSIILTLMTIGILSCHKSGVATLYNLKGTVVNAPCGWVLRLDSIRTSYLINSTIPESFKKDGTKVKAQLAIDDFKGKGVVCDSINKQTVYPAKVEDMESR